MAAAESRVSTGPGVRRLLTGASPAGAVWQLAPSAGFYALFFLVPLGLLAAYSFYEVDQANFQVRPAFSLANFKAAVDTGLYRELILRTVLLGLIVAIVVVVLSYAFAYIATVTFPQYRELLLFLMVASIFGGYLVRIYAWRTILGEEGLINSLLRSVGLIDKPLSFLIFSRFAVVLTLVNFLLPFGVLPLYGAMQNVPRDAMEAARDLGGGPLAVFRTVVLPLTSTGMRIAFAFAFVLASGDYVTPTLVGGTNGQLIGNAIADQFGVAFDWPLGAALAIVTLCCALAVYWAFGRLLRFVAR
jgi:spermidine/putrescine transport system permease protein